MRAVWTTRDVVFVPFPRERDKAESLMDALADYFYGDAPWIVRRLLEPSVSSSSAVVCLGSMPRWMPAWVARRIMAHFAVTVGIGGHAEFRIERVVLT